MAIYCGTNNLEQTLRQQKKGLVPPWNQSCDYELMETFGGCPHGQKVQLDQAHLEINPLDCPGFPAYPDSAEKSSKY